jgi:hypothetical protein
MSVEAAIKRRDRLLAAVAPVYEPGTVVDGFVVSRLTEKLASVLSADVSHSALYRTVLSLLNTTPTRDKIKNLCWAVAADLGSLKEDRPTFPASFDETRPVTVQVWATRYIKFRSEGSVGLKGRVVLGPGTPADLTWSWPARFVSFLATRPVDGLGMDRKPAEGSRPYLNYATLYGMRLSARVTFEDGRVSLKDVRSTGSQRDRNTSLIDMRLRRTMPCPFSYEHHCHLCPKNATECPAACRKETPTERPCLRCGTTFMSDPSWESVCSACLSGRTKKPV